MAGALVGRLAGAMSAALVAAVLVTAAGPAARAAGQPPELPDASQELHLAPGGELKLYENLTRGNLTVPGTLAAGSVRLTDSHTGRPVPLTGTGTEATGSATRIFLPQLPLGEYHLDTDLGRSTIIVTSSSSGATEAPPTPASETPGAGRLILAMSVAAAILVGVSMRRRRGLAVLASGTLLAAGAGVALAFGAGQPTQVNALATSTQACTGVDCKVQDLIAVYDTGGTRALHAALVADKDPYCHQAAHEVGFELWRRDGDVDLAVERMSAACEYGLIHGTAEAMAVFASDQEFPELIEEFCYRGTGPAMQQLCLHGAGHATIWRTNGDLEAAYELCEQMPRVEGTYECHGAAVMEWADRGADINYAVTEGILDLADLSTHELARDSLLEVCANGPRDGFFRNRCYLGLNFRTGSAEDNVSWCSEKEQFVKECFGALGENIHQFVPRTSSTEMPSAAELYDHAQHCLEAPTRGAALECATQAARMTAVSFKSKALSQEFCALWPERDQQYCTTTTRRTLGELKLIGVTVDQT